MKREEIQRSDDEVSFFAEDSTVGYGVLFVLLIIVGAGIIWWWPSSPGELLWAWEGEQWSHLEALACAMLTAIVGAMIVVIGGFLSDRGRCHWLRFDLRSRRVLVDERWRGFRIELEFPFYLFSSFQVHQPVGQQRWWELGAVLRNGSYWRLRRDEQREKLEGLAEEFNESMDFDGAGSIAELERPERVADVDRGDRRELRWTNRERLATQISMAMAAGLFSVAAALPMILVFDGPGLWFWVVTVAAVVLFAIPLFLVDRSRLAWPFVLGWAIVVVAAIGFWGAHWAYFPLGTLGVAIFSKSAADLIVGLWRAEQHSLVIDRDGETIYEDGILLEADGEAVTISELEGALVNVTEMRPAQVQLMWPGGVDASRRRSLAKADPDTAEGGEPLELDGVGLSLFEMIWLSLVIDDEIRRAGEGEIKNPADA